jgi:type III pantothenate kinase
MEAGIFWGTVGLLRELITRQLADLGDDSWVIWTGGDAAILGEAVAGSGTRIEPNLVLLGLCQAQHR